MSAACQAVGQAGAAPGKGAPAGGGLDYGETLEGLVRVLIDDFGRTVSPIA
jgi:hypothetical protein